VLSNGLNKYFAALFFVMICASASPAAANSISLSSHAIAQTMYPTHDTTNNISVGINSDCFAGYFTEFSSMSTTFEHRDMPVGSVSECLEEAVAITLHKDGDTIIWGLAPSLSKVSFNLVDDIKNLQVLLRYRF
jgi:hypothetical protein